MSIANQRDCRCMNKELTYKLTKLSQNMHDLDLDVWNGSTSNVNMTI